VVLLDHMTDLCLVFYEASILFSKVIILAYNMWVPFSQRSHQNLWLLVFLMIGILAEVRWNLSVVLICIFFMASYGKHFFRCFVSITLLPLKKFCLVQLPAMFLVTDFVRV
jgi:hypothetical protein